MRKWWMQGRAEIRTGRLLLGGLRTLGAVLRATLSAILHAGGVERATHDVVTHTGKILDTTTAHKHDGVLLKVVAFTGNIGVNLLTVGETHTSNLTHSRVRLLGSGGVNTHAHTAALGAGVKGRRLALILESYTSLSY